MNFLHAVFTLAWKDIRSESRTKEMISTMLIFSGLVIVVFSFAFDATRQMMQSVVPGLVWVLIIFSGILGLNRSFLNEQKNDNLLGLLGMPVDPAAIYLGKLVANFVLVTVTEMIALPILFLLFDYRWQGSLGMFCLVLLVGTLGFMIIGTFLAALSAHSKSSELLLPVVLFPVVAPILIAAVQSTKLILSNSEQLDIVIRWIKFISVYDLIFFVVALLLFEYLVEV